MGLEEAEHEDIRELLNAQPDDLTTENLLLVDMVKKQAKTATETNSRRLSHNS